MTLNRYVLDANVLVSAVLSPNSTANQAYQKLLKRVFYWLQFKHLQNMKV